MGAARTITFGSSANSLTILFFMKWESSSRASIYSSSRIFLTTCLSTSYGCAPTTRYNRYRCMMYDIHIPLPLNHPALFQQRVLCSSFLSTLGLTLWRFAIFEDSMSRSDDCRNVIWHARRINALLAYA